MSRARSTRPDDCPYVGKGGLKLEAALAHFAIAVQDRVAADLGCHIGGFTDCLLQRGARTVHAVDTAYGVFAWKLRNDPRVVLSERTNALHWKAPAPLDLVVADLGWTRQERSLPVIAALLRPGGEALSLVKPQYEAPKKWLERGVLPDARVPEILAAVRALRVPGLAIVGEVPSPVRGSGGNLESWIYLRAEGGAAPAPG